MMARSHICKRLGFSLVIVGAFLPLVCVTLTDGYLRNAGLLGNLQRLSLSITPDDRQPDFREVASLDSEQGGLQQVKYGNTALTLGFPDSMSEEAMTAAIKAEKRLEKPDLPKFMRFYGWRVVHEGFRIPFKYVASAGLLMISGGLMVYVWTPKGLPKEVSDGRS